MKDSPACPRGCTKFEKDPCVVSEDRKEAARCRDAVEVLDSEALPSRRFWPVNGFIDADDAFSREERKDQLWRRNPMRERLHPDFNGSVVVRVGLMIDVL